jgi:hypothetical protein
MPSRPGLDLSDSQIAVVQSHSECLLHLVGVVTFDKEDLVAVAFNQPPDIVGA